MSFLFRSNAIENLKNAHCPNGLVLYQTESVRELFPDLNQSLERLCLPFWISSWKKESLEETFSRGAQGFGDAMSRYALRESAKCVFLALIADGDEPVAVSDRCRPMFCVTVHGYGKKPARAEERSGCTYLHFQRRSAAGSTQDAQRMAALIFAMVHNPDHFRCGEQLFVQAAFYDAQQQMCALRMSRVLEQYFRADSDERTKLLEKVREGITGEAGKLSGYAAILHRPIAADNWAVLGSNDPWYQRLFSVFSKESVSKAPKDLIRELYGTDFNYETIGEMTREQYSFCHSSARAVWGMLKESPKADASGNLSDALSKIFGDLKLEFDSECSRCGAELRNELSRSQSLRGSSVPQLKAFFEQSDKALGKLMLAREKLGILEELQKISGSDDSFWQLRKTGLEELRTAGNQARNVLVPSLEEYHPRKEGKSIRCSWKMKPDQLRDQCSSAMDSWHQMSLQHLIAKMPPAEYATTKRILLLLDLNLSVEDTELRHYSSSCLAEVLRIQNLGAALALIVQFYKPNIWEEARNGD